MIDGFRENGAEADFSAPHILSSHASQGLADGPDLRASNRIVGREGTVYVEVTRVETCRKCRRKRLALGGAHSPHWHLGKLIDCSGDEVPR